MKNCKICKEPIKKTGKIYCSNECKFKDTEYNLKRSHNLENPKNKIVKCKETGKTFNDVLNLSGTLTKYSVEVLGKDYDELDWEIIERPVGKLLRCPYCNYQTSDYENNSGALTRHCKSKHDKSPKQVIIDHPSYSIYWKTLVKKIKRENEIGKSSIACEICGQRLKKITNSHLKRHGITTKQYKEKYGVDNLSSLRTREKLKNLYFQMKI